MTSADEERLDASRWFWYSDLLERAGLDDVERGSGEVQMGPDDTMGFSVRTTSRGRVTLGTIRTAVIHEVAASLDVSQLAAFQEHVRDAKAAAFDIIRPYAEHLEETYHRKPLAGKAAKKDARRREAIRLRTEEKRSAPYIARALKVHVRTVNRYLHGSETGIDRKTPG